jgi:hypothetical protein
VVVLLRYKPGLGRAEKSPVVKACVDRPSKRRNALLMQLAVDEELFDGFADVGFLECEVASEAGNC